MSRTIDPQVSVRRAEESRPFTLSQEELLGSGGEASVYEIPGDPAHVAKVYHTPRPEQKDKLTWMIGAPPKQEGFRLAWPESLLLDDKGTPVGFTMARVEGPRLFHLYNPVTRRRTDPLFHAGRLLQAAHDLSAAFDALHQAGYVVGDVNESNVLLAKDGTLTLVDTDSFQVRTPQGQVYRSKVGRPEFTPPELQGTHFGQVDRTPEHDRFSLAVLLYLTLMEGTHPFAGEVPGEDTSLDERIRRGTYTYAELPGQKASRAPAGSPPLHLLNPQIQALFARAFVAGHTDPAQRPSAGEWRTTLESALQQVQICPSNPQHRFGRHLKHCPWCERTRSLSGRDPFPRSVEEARKVDQTRTTRKSPSPALKEAPAANLATLTPPLHSTLPTPTTSTPLHSSWVPDPIKHSGNLSYSGSSTGGRHFARLILGVSVMMFSMGYMKEFLLLNGVDPLGLAPLHALIDALEGIMRPLSVICMVVGGITWALSRDY